MPGMTFEEELADDICTAIAELGDCNMPHESKIVCAASLYLFAWLGEEHKDLLKDGMTHILAHLILSKLR
jgi:hypothetical protein